MRTDIRVRGRRVSTISAGDGTTPCFIFHGNSGEGQLFAPLIGSLASPKRKVVAVDFCGHGDSESASDPYNDYAVTGLADFICEAIAALGAKQYFVVGHSVGGHALLECLDRLDGALGVALLSAPPFARAEIASVFKPDPTEGALFTGELSDAAAERLARVLARTATDQVCAIVASIKKVDVRFREALGRSIVEGRWRDEAELAARVPIPSLLIYGEHDPFVNASAFEAAHFCRPWRDGIRKMTNSGHWPHFEEPLEVARILGEFIDDLAPKV